MKKKENPILFYYSEAEKKLLDRRVNDINSGKEKPLSQAEFHKFLRKKLNK